jgi:hypothetical protein
VTTVLWVLAFVVAGLALFLLDRFLLWCEWRGWIYYRKKKASPRSLGSAFLAVQGMLEPGAEHAAEALREEGSESDESGGPPSDEGTRGSAQPPPD